jgi:hypothetical protein
MAVYLVTREGSAEGEKPRMVEARTKTSAIAHVARSTFAAEPISTKTAVGWSKQGVEIEEAGSEE